jgi:hypothetical protein
VLPNPTPEQSLELELLSAFSFYLMGRKNVLLAVAHEIMENLDRGFASTPVDGGKIERAEVLDVALDSRRVRGRQNHVPRASVPI